MATYLITGTSRGIGLGLVTELLDNHPGSHVIATARNLNNCNKLKELKNSYPDRLTLLELDVSSTQSVKAAAAIVETQFPKGINYLINNSGTSGSSSECNEDMFSEVMDVNVVGVMRVVQAFLPLVEKIENSENSENSNSKLSKRSISVVSSLAGTFPAVEFVSDYIAKSGFAKTSLYPYRASKACINYLFACLAADYRKEGIIFTALHPGQVDTDMNIGENPISVVESAQGLIKVVNNVTLEDSGKCYDYNGVVHQF